MLFASGKDQREMYVVKLDGIKEVLKFNFTINNNMLLLIYKKYKKSNYWKQLPFGNKTFADVYLILI